MGNDEAAVQDIEPATAQDPVEAVEMSPTTEVASKKRTREENDEPEGQREVKKVDARDE